MNKQIVLILFIFITCFSCNNAEKEASVAQDLCDCVETPEYKESLFLTKPCIKKINETFKNNHERMMHWFNIHCESFKEVHSTPNKINI